MFTCTLSPEDVQIIIEILEQTLTDLRSEQRRTENFQFKQRLEKRETAIRNALNELKNRKEISPQV